MTTQTQVRPWLWPDHVIGKRASRLLREEHNAVVNSHAELLEAAGLVLGWIDRAIPTNEIDAEAVAALRAAIATAEGVE